MNVKKAVIRAILLSAYMWLIPIIATADTIYLKNGQTVEGDIVNETDKIVVLKKYVAGGEGKIAYSKTDVEKIVRGALKREPDSTQAQEKIEKPSAAGIRGLGYEYAYRAAYLAGQMAKNEGLPYDPDAVFNLPVVQAKMEEFINRETLSPSDRAELVVGFKAGHFDGFRDGYYGYPRKSTRFDAD